MIFNSLTQNKIRFLAVYETYYSQIWWHMPAVPIFRRLTQKYLKSEAILGYIQSSVCKPGGNPPNLISTCKHIGVKQQQKAEKARNSDVR